jgi:hypothetical protein
MSPLCAPIQITGETKAFANYPLPKSFAVGNVPYAGRLLSSWEEPFYWDWTRAGLKRFLIANWDCCDKPPIHTMLSTSP